MMTEIPNIPDLKQAAAAAQRAFESGDLTRQAASAAQRAFDGSGDLESGIAQLLDRCWGNRDGHWDGTFSGLWR